MQTFWNLLGVRETNMDLVEGSGSERNLQGALAGAQDGEGEEAGFQEIVRALKNILEQKMVRKCGLFSYRYITNNDLKFGNFFICLIS